jgi:hypothetical protein
MTASSRSQVWRAHEQNAVKSLSRRVGRAPYVALGRAMPKGKKTKTGIYHPPKPGMPYLVVTVSPEGVTATAVETKDEARILASKKSTAVVVDDATGKS